MTELVAKIVGAALLVGMALLGASALWARPIPEALVVLTSSALTGLLGLLAPSRHAERRRQAPEGDPPPPLPEARR